MLLYVFTPLHLHIKILKYKIYQLINMMHRLNSTTQQYIRSSNYNLEINEYFHWDQHVPTHCLFLSLSLHHHYMCLFS